jgi:hypothetical protein
MARRRAAIDRFYLWRRIPGPAALIQLPVNLGLTGYFETRPIAAGQVSRKLPFNALLTGALARQGRITS